MSQAIFFLCVRDADAARRLCDALRAARLEVWFDQSESRGGDAWNASIRKHPQPNTTPFDALMLK